MRQRPTLAVLVPIVFVAGLVALPAFAKAKAGKPV